MVVTQIGNDTSHRANDVGVYSSLAHIIHIGWSAFKINGAIFCGVHMDAPMID